MSHILDSKKPEIKDSIVFSQSPTPTTQELKKRLLLVENQINWLQKIRKTLETQLDNNNSKSNLKNFQIFSL